uniref:RING-type E3 ubiquitin transferase n=1 Tax=Solanum tuberosum TaxID=4113 RepID=M1DIX3_SOLTU
MEGGINITNLSDSDSIDRLLRSDNQNWINPPNYLTRFDSDDQKEEDSILKYIKTRTHHVIVPKDGVNINPAETEEICAICHIEFEHEEIVGILGCGHEYHVGCIKQWLLRKKDCPMCRASVVPSTPTKIYIEMHSI